MSCSVAVLGCGPIGAATALRLAEAGVPDVVLVGDPGTGGAYRSSGGSVCWHRSDPEKAAMISATADFVRARVAAGAAIRLSETPYLFLDLGVLVPALNVSAIDLVADLVGLATAAGVRRRDLGRVHAVRPRPGGGHRVHGEHGELDARVVLLALGTGNAELVPLPRRPEKRQLFVLDLPVDADRAAMPHVVAPIGDGYAYVFVKHTTAGPRVVLGQEDLVADEDLTGPVDHFAALLDAGAADRFPFLRGAGVQRLLWGLDWAGKLPHLAEHASGLLSVNCGSAVRGCVAIGDRAAALAAAALDRV